ncbi:hypothetical protein Pan258_40060 [Symmachiella dynata]|nr:hypothetical protein Pan258_40060 [Symmachiella dynata]
MSQSPWIGCRTLKKIDDTVPSATTHNSSPQANPPIRLRFFTPSGALRCTFRCRTIDRPNGLMVLHGNGCAKTLTPALSQRERESSLLLPIESLPTVNIPSQ